MTLEFSGNRARQFMRIASIARYFRVKCPARVSHFPQPEGANMAKGATKSEILTSIAESTGLSRKQVGATFEALSELIKANVGKKGPGLFVVPGLMKITVIQKPAVKARKGINPFTKMEQMFKAKPARKVIKVRPLKALKDMAK
jgi:nucleoid DNA-binding protein